MMVPYETLAFHVERMYSKKFDLNDAALIDKHCQEIADFIRSCGWTEESYFERFCQANPIIIGK